jgi:hypothetical protein
MPAGTAHICRTIDLPLRLDRRRLLLLPFCTTVVRDGHISGPKGMSPSSLPSSPGLDHEIRDAGRQSDCRDALRSRNSTWRLLWLWSHAPESLAAPERDQDDSIAGHCAERISLPNLW